MADRGRGFARTPAKTSGYSNIKRSAAAPQPPPGEKPKRESILDLAKYVNEKIRVKFTGGREVTGVLKGYDQLLNLVLDDVEELLLDPEPHTRNLGLVVLRGPTITIISPVDGFEEIDNPFAAHE
ncbi:hypothetical protein APHAL10511_002820 [Amanita phalloides]|nr:hypothetical protein APHAL10511_002820 [Amanita phalloides]